MLTKRQETDLEHALATILALVTELGVTQEITEIAAIEQRLDRLHQEAQNKLDELGAGDRAEPGNPEDPGREASSQAYPDPHLDMADPVIGYQVKKPGSEDFYSQHQRRDLAFQSREKAERLAGPGHEVLALHQSGRVTPDPGGVVDR